MCGTAAEITPVREVDDRRIGAGEMGPMTREIQATFFRAVRGLEPRYADWLSPVDAPAVQSSSSEQRAVAHSPAGSGLGIAEKAGLSRSLKSEA